MAQQPVAPAVAARPRRAVVAALVGAALFLVYISNLRMLSSGDNIPTRLLPFSILREHNLDLDEFPRVRSEPGRAFYWVIERNGHLYSGSPVLTSLVITPLYLIPAWWLSAYRIPYDDVRAQLLFVVMERLAAAALTALSASLLFIVLRRLVRERWALAITLLYGLGTSTWRFSGQALWTHVLSELALVILCTIFLREDAKDKPSLAAFVLAGLTVAVAVGNRPQMLGFALLTAAFVWNHHRRHFAAFAALPLFGGAAVMMYNVAIFRSLAGAYGGFNHFSTPLLTGLAGLFFSPNRGLFIFTPIFLFAVWGAVQVWRTNAHPWMRYMVIGVLLHVALYAKFDEWWAGYAFGPRYFTDVAPLLCLFLVYGLVPLCHTRPVAVLCAALAVCSVGIQAIGVYCDDDDWNLTPVHLELHPERVWDWSDLHLVRAFRSGWHGGELLPLFIGAFRDPVPVRLAILRTADLASEVTVRSAPARLRHGGSQPVVASITNRGTQAWPTFSFDYTNRGIVFLVVRWLASGRPVSGVGDVVKLPKNVCPGEVVQVPFQLTAPPQPGQYEVELRVAQVLNAAGGLSSDDTYRFPLAVD
ncbi:MAG TPA: hypothetical protein VF515_19505 [Candidatus Binatia bacterium]